MNATISILRDAINARIQNEVSENVFVDYRNNGTIEDFTVKLRLQQSQLTNDRQRDFFERLIAIPFFEKARYNAKERFDFINCNNKEKGEFNYTIDDFFDELNDESFSTLSDLRKIIKETSTVEIDARDLRNFVATTATNATDKRGENFYYLNLSLNLLRANEMLNDYRNALRDFQRGNGGAINERMIAIEKSLKGIDSSLISIDNTICTK